MRAIFAVIACMAAATAHAEQKPTYDELLDDARAAFEAEDWSQLALTLDAAQELRPFSLFITRNRVLAHTLRADYARATEIAQEIADRGLALDLTGHPGFEALVSRSGFADVKKRYQENSKPFGASTTVVEIADTGLLPESVVKTTRADEFYIGSVRTGKILSRNDAFATAPGGVYDLEIIDGDVWAAANSAPPYEGADEEPSAGLFRYGANADNGQVLGAYIVDEGDALLGDIEATPKGVVASDSITPRIFLLNEENGRLEVLAADDRFVNLQGVAYDERRDLLFIADYLAGLFALNLSTGAVTPIANPSGAHLGGIDGLYLYRGDLIAIQNGTTPQRIVRIDLNRQGDKAKKMRVLIQNHPDWSEPTNGYVDEDMLFYVATSNWPAYDANGDLREDVPRAPLRIMGLDLTGKGRGD